MGREGITVQESKSTVLIFVMPKKKELSIQSSPVYFTASLPIAVMWLNMTPNLCDSYKLRGSQTLVKTSQYARLALNIV